MKDYPIIKFTLFFITGIILQFYLPINQTTLFYLFLGSILILLLVLFFKNQYVYAIIGKTIFIPIILLGAFLFSKAFTSVSHYPYKLPKIKNTELYGTVTKIELARNERMIFYIQTDSIKYEEINHKYSTKVMCNIYDEMSNISSAMNRLKIGNYVQFKATISRPKNDRNPYEFNYEKYLSDRGISMLATSYVAANVKILNNKHSLFGQSLYEIRRIIDEKIALLHNNTTQGLLRGLILADRSGIDYNTNIDFMNAGVVHVLSVSGLHVGYIVLIFLFLFNRFNLYWRIGLTIVCLFIYMLITGSEAPVFRSTLMASIILATPFLGRSTNGYNTLSIAALIILLLNPFELFNPSFQLSFSAILALIMFYPPINGFVNNLKIKNVAVKYFILFLGSTLIAQIGTLPFTLVYFGRISITSIAANFIVIPLSGIIVGLGFVSIALSSVSIWASSIYASCNEFLTYSLYYIVKIFGNPDYSFVSIRQFSLYDSILFYLSFGLLFGLWKYFTNYKSKTAFAILVLTIFVLFLKLDDEELILPNKLTVIGIDVGQGDSFLITFPNGKTALIDAGEATKHFDNGKRVILPLLEKLGIDKIDYAFISHIDSDHYMGILELIKKRKIVELYKPSLDIHQIKDIDFEKILKRTKVPFRYYSKSNLNIGNAKLYFLKSDSHNYSSTNDNSGVIKLVYGNSSFLFTGDIGIEVEKNLIKQYGLFLESDVLKVSHHGSKSSSSENLLSTVKPKFALISAGIMNKFKHPSQEVIARLRSFNIKILRTDSLGACILRSDGEQLEIVNWRDN